MFRQDGNPLNWLPLRELPAPSSLDPKSMLPDERGGFFLSFLNRRSSGISLSGLILSKEQRTGVQSTTSYDHEIGNFPLRTLAGSHFSGSTLLFPSSFLLFLAKKLHYFTPFD